MPNKPKPQKRPWVPERAANDKMQKRVRSVPEYHTSRWTKSSQAFRAAHPLCKICESKGVIKESKVVDHIVPVPICEDFWDETNWQALCNECNIEKGNRDKRLINGRGITENNR